LFFSRFLVSGLLDQIGSGSSPERPLHDSNFPQYLLDATVERICQVSCRKPQHTIALSAKPCIAYSILVYLLRREVMLSIDLDDEVLLM
jgi:hypothetical protein